MKQFFNQKMFSDVEPFEIIEVISPKRVKVRAMNAERLDNPVYNENHRIVNNAEIRYDYSSCEDGHEVIITKRKDGNWYQLGHKSGHYETKFLNENKPCKYYDYTF